MCGIFSILNNFDSFPFVFVAEQFQKGKNRGPEYSALSHIGLGITAGFHRLAINGLNPESNQPIVDDNISLICNGEIYNYKELYKQMDIQPKTQSDCEVIIHLYRRYGIEHTLQMLDGVFAFVLLENSIAEDNTKVFVARDPYGVRPLYILKPYKSRRPHKLPIYAFASELKMLNEFCEKLNDDVNSGLDYEVKQFLPGSYSSYCLSDNLKVRWHPVHNRKKYHSTGFNSIMFYKEDEFTVSTIAKNISNYLVRAVEKRCVTTERPIACLLSGGLDSSLIAALVNQYHKMHDLPTLETYSIGLEGSEDLRYAKKVADYLGTKHTEILLTEQDFLDAIPEVIYAIESYDTTSVRASIGNYLLGKYISQHSNAKVIFNGDGSDELCGGYLYMSLAKECVEFDREVRRLLSDIHLYDVLRSDKCISSHGLEPRTPFLDRSFVQYYLSIPPQIRFHKVNHQCEKFLLRTAFSEKYYVNYENKPILPLEVLWRRKEAFSDGVSVKTRSLYEIIQEHAVDKVAEMDMIGKYYGKHLDPTTDEQYYYRHLFESKYPGMGKIVPYFWMPKYLEGVTDPSARTLDIYKEPDTS
jgi:asparagine synthase (glutamine-hydrolysing)